MNEQQSEQERILSAIGTILEQLGGDEYMHKNSRRLSSSVNSLKELVIILTGLTITSGFILFMKGAIRIMETTKPNQIVTIITTSRIEHIGLLLLLVLCVFRFYHGNIMYLDKHYLENTETAQRPGKSRIFWLDFVFISGMSIGFSAMGCSIIYPLFYFVAYAIILLLSVLWLVISLSIMVDKASIEVSDLKAPLKWLVVNIIALSIIAALLGASISTMIDAPNMNAKIPLNLNEYEIALLSIIVLLNSVVDIGLNWKEYFPE